MDEASNSDSDSEVMFGGTLEQLRDQALMMFNFCIASQTDLPIPPVTDTHRKYLSVNEVEAIVAEKADDVGCGYAFGATSRGELLEQVHAIMHSLLMRIRSNILHEGVKQGYLDSVFDPEKNDFDFEVTEKGEEFNEEQFREFWGGFDRGGGAANDSDGQAEDS